MMFYGIYKITNLLNGKMYIGKHKTDNLDDGYMGSGLLLQRSMKKHGIENFRKEWMMFCEDEDEMNYMERVFVDQTWVDRSDTYNLAVGGQGGTLNNLGRKHGADVRENMSMAAKERIKKYGHPRGMLGHKHTRESIEKMVLHSIGRKNPNAAAAMRKSRSQPVAQYDKNMNLISTYNSIADAEKHTGLSHGNICQCCMLNPKIKTVGGFTWRYFNN